MNCPEKMYKDPSFDRPSQVKESNYLKSIVIRLL